MINPILKKYLPYILGALGVLVVGGAVIAPQYLNKKPIACTDEAMICPDGSAVGRTGPNCEFAQCPKSPGKCYVSGCSGEICSDQENVITTCVYKEEYICYKVAKCERQSNGQCGWTQTLELQSCFMGK